MTAPAHGPRGDERGFILVGVVMMALALTILALSLFSLSGYEAQFYRRTSEVAQAQQTALGEIDRARHRLTCLPYRLENVGTQLPTGVVTDAWQIQSGDTARSGPVDWDHGEYVHIDTRVTIDGLLTEASGQFRPQAAASLYKRVVTTADSLTINPLGADGTPRSQTVNLVNGVWQNYPDYTWRTLVRQPPTAYKSGGVPVPDIGTYLNQAADPTPPGGPTTIGGQTWLTYTLTGLPGGQVHYYRHPDYGTSDFTYVGSMPTMFNVSGRVVWMLQLGLHMQHRFAVVPQSPDACLMIVASPNRIQPGTIPWPNMGIWLQGGIDAPNIPVILVSDGGVYIDQDTPNSVALNTSTLSLSIFARDVRFTGPQSGYQALMQYSPSIGAPLIDDLASQGALPNTSPSSNYRLPLVAGTWAMTTP